MQPDNDYHITTFKSDYLINIKRKEFTMEILTGQKAADTCHEILGSFDENTQHYEAYPGAVGYFFEDGHIVAFDNTSKDCWIEEFKSTQKAMEWCREGQEIAKQITL